MSVAKLDEWKKQLLDTGKRNHLINFKDSKSGVLEILLPDISLLLSKAETNAKFEVVDTEKNADDDDELTYKEREGISREDFLALYEKKVKKASHVLLYNATGRPTKVLKGIHKRQKTILEETGVNVAYMTFGLIHWCEKDDPTLYYEAPLLLTPVYFSNASAIDPYYIHLTEEDIVLNPTFAFKLKTDYRLELPEYNDEPIDEYIAKIEELVGKLNWTVTKECKIGLFSFLKINMYRDLTDNAKKILQNDNIRALLKEDTNPITSYKEFTGNPLMDLHTVVDADASQLEALKMAESGRSFVLQGPPGTGKSQTITNIIAQCLYSGKKVLFVSEKVAALNVVYDKLKKAGLEEFCLELHSYKANKKAFIDELCKTLNTPKTNTSYEVHKNDLYREKAQELLDNYEIELHKERPIIKKSLFSLFEYYAKYNKTDFYHKILALDTKDEDHLQNETLLLDKYARFVPSIGYNYKNHPFYGYDKTTTSTDEKQDLKEKFADFLVVLTAILTFAEEMENRYGIVITNHKDFHNYSEFVKFVATSKALLPNAYEKKTLKKLAEALPKLGALSVKILADKKTLSEEFDKEIFAINGEDLTKKLTRQYNGLLVRLFNKDYKKLAEDLHLMHKNGKKLSYNQLLSYANMLMDLQKNESAFNEQAEKVKEYFTKEYNGVKTNWKLFTAEATTALALLENAKNLGTFAKVQPEVFEEEQKVLSDYANDLSIAFEGKENTIKNVTTLFNPAEYDFDTKTLSEIYNKIATCRDGLDALDNWCQLYFLLGEMEKSGVKDFLDSEITAEIPADSFADVYSYNFYKQWIEKIIASVPSLAQFNRNSQDETVSIFMDKDAFQGVINTAKIKTLLSNERPSLSMLSPTSTISLLLREKEKKRKQKPIRTLLCEAGELIQLIKPCFLMSPLSVSTFLNDSGITFDTVVFDEASQIFPHDAVGAIYRGKQLIVVGDSKQMPPSNFFNASNESEDEEEDDDTNSFGSILDMCSAGALAQLRLKWHYRSRFEELIAFSNKNFYDGELVTFPSPTKKKEDIGVDYISVDGLFDHSTKTNKQEAEKVVELVLEHIKKHPNRSLGVVAFSISQENLIDKLLSKKRRNMPENEFFFNEDGKEPFFIKNLETVQGDERDTIIFSTAYGKDANGKLMHNFGPLNRVGGERRLNVAITRAKINVKLVSSMHDYDIDLSKTSSEGARLLKEYLAYAENGTLASSKPSASLNVFEQESQDLEEEIAKFLNDNGYETEVKVGKSDFKIDVCVKMPNSEDFVLAIECDGANYHASKNARDRDRLRQEVLQKMGWSYYRIWSTDWYKNNKTEKENLLKEVEKAIKAHEEAPKEQTLSAPQPEPDVILPTFEEEKQEEHFEFPIYKTVSVESAHRKFPTDFQGMMLYILQEESPLSKEWLLKRLAPLYGREKVTSVVENQYQTNMWNCEQRGIFRRNGFLYVKSQNPMQLRISDAREPKYISPEELASGMVALVKINVQTDKEGLFKLLAKQLGISRMGDAITQQFENAFSLAKTKLIQVGNEWKVK